MLQGLLKLKHFDSQATNFGPVLPNSRKRLRNFCHSIGEINIVLFPRLVLKQWALSLQQIHGSRLAIRHFHAVLGYTARVKVT